MGRRRRVAKVRSQQDRDVDRMVDMVIDAADLEFDLDREDNPEADSSNFYRMLKDANEPL